MRTFDGTVSIAQPLIEPMFGAKSVRLRLLALLVGRRGMRGGDYEPGAGNGEERLFEGAVHGVGVEAVASFERGGCGFGAETPKRVERNVASEAAAFEHTCGTIAQDIRDAEVSTQEAGGGRTVICTAGARLHDGRFANNGWLMELPDPMTRVSVGQSPDHFAGDGGQAGRSKVGRCGERGCAHRRGRSATPAIEAVVYVLPGQPEDTFAAWRWDMGARGWAAVADGVGSNAYLCGMRRGDDEIEGVHLHFKDAGRQGKSAGGVRAGSSRDRQGGQGSA